MLAHPFVISRDELLKMATKIQTESLPASRGDSGEKADLKQSELLRRRTRRAEVLSGDFPLGGIETEALARNLEAAPNHPCHWPGTGHALAPGGIVILAATGIADELENMVMAVRKILL